MRKNIVAVFVLMLCLLTGCGKGDESQLTQRDDGAPYSQWDEHPAGSAKYLDEKSILVSVYVDDRNADWNKYDEKRIKKNLRLACDYLEEQGAIYGKKVELIYDIEEHPDLMYRFDYDKEASYEFGSDDSDEMKDDVRQFIKENVDTEELLKKYDCNSVAYLVFVDGAVDSCIAQQYYYNINDDFEEVAFFGTSWNTGVKIYPNTFAHEILHLFGARDLYYARPAVGTSREFVDYVAKEYPKDIMLGNSADVYIDENYVFSEITKITAYDIGWVDYIYELEQYPEIKNQIQSASAYDFEKHQDHSKEYTIEPRNTFLYTHIIYALEIVIIAYILIMTIRNRVRYKRYLADMANEESDNQVWEDDKNN